MERLVSHDMACLHNWAGKTRLSKLVRLETGDGQGIEAEIVTVKIGFSVSPLVGIVKSRYFVFQIVCDTNGK